MDAPHFDNWAKNYDNDVMESKQAETYPFAGYDHVLDTIARLVLAEKSGKILDLGAGSGMLSSRFYDAGWEVTAVDFSEEMLKQARERMPEASFLIADFAKALPKDLEGQKFDFIVMTYAFHHIDAEKQAHFLRSLLPFLTENGKILLGDISFETKEDLEKVKLQSGEGWDDEEFYPIIEELRAQLPDLQFEYEVISFCATVMEITR
jgi:putative AdoMet-dependent methyltransferase